MIIEYTTVSRCPDCGEALNLSTCPYHVYGATLSGLVRQLRDIADIMCANNWPDQDYWNIGGEGYETFMFLRTVLKGLDRALKPNAHAEERHHEKD